jgi:3-phosphoglycerate kinase
MQLKSIKNINFAKGTRVLVRCDFDIPLKNGKIKDIYRLEQSLETIKYLIKKDCVIILLSHLGRPKGKDEKFSFKPIAGLLAEMLGRRISFMPEIFGQEVDSVLARAKPGDVIMLENLRFNKGELDNSSVFARKLSAFGEIYVNNAFAVSHRKSASVCAIKKYLPAYAGLMLIEEINNLSRVLQPQKPLMLIMGGIKLETKIPLIKNLYKHADKILLGGGLANNVLASMGYEIGRSLSDRKSVKLAGNIKRDKLILPVDAIVSDRTGQSRYKKISEIAKTDTILDIGPETIRLFSFFIRQANTLVWNGPLGMFESPRFKHGTLAIAQLLASRSKGNAFGVVGGGETIEALNKAQYFSDVDWASTGGGAMLSFLSGKKMPGLESLII